MKNSQKHLRIYLFSLFAIILSASVLRTVAILRDLDFATGYFDEKPLIIVASALVIAMAILSLSYPVVAKRVRLVAAFDNMATNLPSGLAAVALIFISANLLSSETLGGTAGVLSLLSALLALAAAAYFLYNALVLGRKSLLRGWLCLATVMFLITYACYLYFDVSLPLNSPNRVTDMMAYLFAAVFFLFEARISIGRDAWHRYIVFGLIASLLTAYSSIPAIITYFVRGAVISNSIAESALSFTLFIFITARLILVSELSEDEKSEFAVLVEDISQKRLAELSEALASRACEDVNVENEESADDEGEEFFNENYTIDFGISDEELTAPEIADDISEKGDGI